MAGVRRDGGTSMCMPILLAGFHVRCRNSMKGFPKCVNVLSLVISGLERGPFTSP
jgi:hypothetical protein